MCSQTQTRAWSDSHTLHITVAETGTGYSDRVDPPRGDLYRSLCRSANMMCVVCTVIWSVRRVNLFQFPIPAERPIFSQASLGQRPSRYEYQFWACRSIAPLCNRRRSGECERLLYGCNGIALDNLERPVITWSQVLGSYWYYLGDVSQMC